MSSKWYVLFGDLAVVKGYARSAIYDLTRKSYKLISNDLANFLDKLVHHPIKISEVEEGCIREERYIDFLLSTEYIFKTKSPELFNRMNQSWCKPSKITNFIWDYSGGNIDQVSDIVNKWNIKAACIYFSKQFNNEDIFEVLKSFESTPLGTIELCLDSGVLNSEKLDYIADAYSRVVSIVVYSASNNEVLRRGFKGSTTLVYSTKAYQSNSSDCLVNPFSFRVNLSNYLESGVANLHFNKRLYINDAGEVHVGCQTDSPLFHLDDWSSLVSGPIEEKLFECNLYKSVKTKTDICRDCEFKRMCLDNRLPIKRKSDHAWYHTTECNYNPYIAKWKGEEGYRTLAECGVKSDKTGFSIDHERIAKINEELWGEET